MADITKIKLPSGDTYNIKDNTSGYATLASPTFTGTPTAPTQDLTDDSTKIATTGFVKSAIAGLGSGTVTSVGITNATNGGLSISNSPIVDAGNITVGHSNVLTNAATTQALYPVKIDKNGHISAYGSAVTSLPASDVYSWAKASTKPTYTASDVGALASSLKGAASGVAELDAEGKVPSSQLPSYVDDVLEYANYSSFPATGETGKIYIAQDTNKTYRWSGTAYVEISASLALGETSSTAYRGDRGKVAYDHSQSTHARTDATKTEASTTNGNIKINGTETTVYTHPSGTNPHGTTKSDVGLGNVGNFKAVSTEASQGLTDTEKSNARANIGAGTSSLTIGTSSTTAAAGNHTHDYSDTYAAKSHTHTTSLATDTGTSSITLASAGKYKLTAGGTSVIFTMPTSNNYSHPTYSAANAAAIKVGRDSTGHVVLGGSLTASDVGAASSSHTHTTSIASSTGTSTLDMAANTKYQLSTGGTTFIFKTPANPDYSDTYEIKGHTHTVTIDPTKTSVYSITSVGTANTPTVIDTTKFSGGSYSHSGFSGGSGSFTQGTFSGGSGSFTQGSFSGGSLTMTMDTTDTYKLNIAFTAATHGTDSHTHVAATHGTDSHTHTGATYGTDSFTPASLATGFYTAGTAATMPTRTQVSNLWNGYNYATAEAYQEIS